MLRTGPKRNIWICGGGTRLAPPAPQTLWSWAAEGTVDADLDITGADVWAGNSTVPPPTYQVRDSLTVVRFTANSFVLQPFGVNGFRDMMFKGGVFEARLVFYLSGGTPLILFQSGDYDGNNTWRTGIYSADLRVEEYIVPPFGGTDHDEFYDAPHGLTLPGWVHLRVQIDYVNGTFSVGIANDATPTTWDVVHTIVDPDNSFWPVFPQVRFLPYGNTFDWLSYEIEKTA